MDYPLLDTIIENHGSGASVLSEEHNPANVTIDTSAEGRGRPSGMWDAAEYGISLSEAQRQWDEADTPEKRAIVSAELKQRALSRAGLDTSKGRVAMFSARVPAWHGLGTVVDRAATSAEAIKFAGLDWEVRAQQLAFLNPITGTQTDAQGAFGVVRQDTGEFLGAVGGRYKPVQNVEAFSFLDSVLADHGAAYETAGSLHGGKRVWILANLPGKRFSVNGKDRLEPYLLFSNSHDGTGAATCYSTTVRVECANTYRTSRKDERTGIRIRHTGSIKAKIEDARLAAGLAVRSIDTFREKAEALAAKPLPIRAYANDVLDAVLDITQAEMAKGADILAAAVAKTTAGYELERKSFERKIERRGEVLADILERYESDRCGTNGMRGTAWAAWNAITEHADHHQPKRRVGSLHEQQSRRFESIMDGDADLMKETALQFALKA